MAYCLQKDPTFTTVIDVVEPGTSDTGETVTASFVGKFVRLDNDQVTEMINARESDLVQMRKLLIGWVGLVDAAGAEVPFSEATRDALLSIPAAQRAIAHAYWEGLRGAARKN